VECGHSRSDNSITLSGDEDAAVSDVVAVVRQDFPGAEKSMSAVGSQDSAQSRREAVIAVAMALGCAMVFAGCDPGFSYRPQHWQSVRDGATTQFTSFDDVALETDGIFGLIGSRSISPELAIRNNSNYPLIIEGAELITETRRLSGVLPNDDASEPRTVKSGAVDRVAIRWTFSELAIDALGTNPRVELAFRRNDERKRLEITYEKVR
jgi:hypothetical protein